MRYNKKLNFIEVFLLFSLSYLYVFILPWRNFFGQEFIDLVSYSNNLEILLSGANLVFEFDSLLALFISKEPLWTMILFQLRLFEDNYFGFSIISMIALLLYSSFFKKRIPFLLYILLILNPLFVDLIMSQIRIALAFSIFLVTFDIKNKLLKYLLICSTIMIHSAMLLIIFLFYTVYLVTTNFKNKYSYFFIIIFSFLFIIFMKYGIDFTLELLGLEDRRKNYSEIISGPNITYTLFWLLLGIYLILRVRLRSIENEDLFFLFYTIMITPFAPNFHHQ